MKKQAKKKPEVPATELGVQPEAGLPPPPVRGGLQELFLDELRPWPGNRDLGDLAELVESVRAQGVLQPVLVRPHPEDAAAYQVVAGHRRVEAARRAKLQRVPALVRDLDDRQALEIQLVENLQRRDLHPLEEAEGYELLVQKHGHSAESLAARVGRSKAYVYARLKLLDLGKEARTAFRAGKVEASVALLLARVPAPLQAEAVEAVLYYWGEDQPPTFREASEVLRTRFMLRLDQAPFDRKDAELVPEAGACGPCPRRTGNQPDLFGDVGKADHCTDPTCFAKKKAAHFVRLEAAAVAENRKVFTGKAATKALHDPAWVDPDAELASLDWKKPRQVLKKKLPPAAVAITDRGAKELVSRKELEQALKEAGFKPKKRAAPANLGGDDYGKKLRAKRAECRALVEACLAVSVSLPLADAAAILADYVLEEVGADVRKRLLSAAGEQGHDLRPLRKKVGPAGELRLALEAVFESSTEASPWVSGWVRPVLARAMKTLGVDAKAVLAAARKAAKSKDSKKKGRGGKA